MTRRRYRLQSWWMNERWKPVPGFEGYYEISDYGRVKSLSRPVNAKHDSTRIKRERILKHQITDENRHSIGLRSNNKVKRFGVHQLVMLAFVGPYPVGKEIAHNDGNPANNHLSNLRYATKKENAADRILHGTETVGERNAGAKITELTALCILTLAPDYSRVELASAYNTTVGIVGALVRGETWQCLWR